MAPTVSWPLVTLKEVAGKAQYGWTSSARADADGLPMLRTTDITHGAIEWSRVPRCTVSPTDPTRYLLRTDDILVSRAGSVGVSALLSDPPESIFASYLMRLRPGPLILPRFLALFLQSPGYWAQISAVTNGIALPNINGSKLGAVQMPLPPIEEQQRIVDILEDHLSRLDAADQAVHDAQRRTHAYRQAALSAITEAHSEQRVELREMVERIEAGRSFGSSERPAEKGEWGIIKVSAMTWGEFRPYENKAVKDVSRVDPGFEIRANDLLVSRANTAAYVGAPVLVRTTPSRLLLSDKSLRIIPKEGCSTAYLLRVLSAPAGRRQMSEKATGTKDSMRNISQASLMAVLVPWANADGQAAVVSAADELDRACSHLLASIETALARSKALRRSLLSDAFAGRLTAPSDLDRVEVLADV